MNTPHCCIHFLAVLVIFAEWIVCIKLNNQMIIGNNLILYVMILLYPQSPFDPPFFKGGILNDVH